MKRKVAYNACHGGFTLTAAAVRLGRELSGKERWAGAVLPGEYFDDGSGPASHWPGHDSVHIDYSFPRHDGTLVSVIEQLGKAASGTYSDLRIAEVEGKYRIDEYDGAETVETPESYDWVE